MNAVSQSPQSANASAAVPVCVLCGSPSSRVREELTGKQIQALWAALGVALSSAAMQPMRLDSRVRLYECGQCGLCYYDPEFAGTAEFYEELMATAPYAEIRPEFDYALRLATHRGLRRVLDIGGGEGAFLDRARQQGLETIGLELNRHAAAKAAAKGHRMITQNLADIPLADLGGGMEFITLFQVLEHVPAPPQFIREVARLLKPGGLLVVAVPNERMFNFYQFDPANWPPHHVSRWQPRSFAWLGRALGLKVLAIEREPLLASEIAHFWRGRNQVASVVGQRQLPTTPWLPLLTSLYRYLGCKYYFPRRGMGLFAVFEKP